MLCEKREAMLGRASGAPIEPFAPKATKPSKGGLCQRALETPEGPMASAFSAVSDLVGREDQACASSSVFLMRTGPRFLGASAAPSAAAAFFLGAGLSADSSPAAASASRSSCEITRE